MESNVYRLRVNGKRVRVEASPEEPLLWVLRDSLGLTGAKFGCGYGACGACSVLINGAARRSCVVPMTGLSSADRIVTVEGLARSGRLSRVQRAFVERTGFSCGFCTPGMVIAATALLADNPEPTREEIVSAMNSNLCRCGVYQNIIESIEVAAAPRRARDRD